MMQTKGNDGKTIWEHGVDVKNKLLHILKNLNNLQTLESERPLPTWFKKNVSFFLPMKNNWKPIRIGLKFHDCGKPFCATTDEQGIHHFPKHWELSIKKFQEYGLQEISYQDFYDLNKHPDKSYKNIHDEYYKYCNNLEVQKKADYYIRRDFEAHILKCKDEDIRKFLLDNKESHAYKPFNLTTYKKSVQLLLICYCEILSNYGNDPDKFKKAFDRLEKIGNRVFEIFRDDFFEEFAIKEKVCGGNA